MHKLCIMVDESTVHPISSKINDVVILMKCGIDAQFGITFVHKVMHTHTSFSSCSSSHPSNKANRVFMHESNTNNAYNSCFSLFSSRV